MLADLFVKDYNAMVAQGVKFTPGDIVRLNALALKVKLAAKPFRDVHLPRAVFLDDGGWFSAPLVLREPTIAHELWLEQMAQHINMSAEYAFRAVYLFALSRPASRLPALDNPRRAISRIHSFARRWIGKLTSDQLVDAITYVLHGADWMACESAPGKSEASDGSSDTIGVILGALARRIPLSLDDAKRMTASEILTVTLSVCGRDGDIDADTDRRDALGEYVRAREEIRERGKRPCP